MAKDISAKKEKAKGFVGGSSLYQQRAAQALHLLVRQAKVLQPVFYKALAFRTKLSDFGPRAASSTKSRILRDQRGTVLRTR